MSKDSSSSLSVVVGVRFVVATNSRSQSAPFCFLYVYRLLSIHVDVSDDENAREGIISHGESPCLPIVEGKFGRAGLMASYISYICM
jgi:hypothetical protein